MRAELDTSTRWELVGATRLREVAAVSHGDPDLSLRVARLMAMSIRGLTQMYDAAHAAFPQTMRGSRSDDGPQLKREGENLRYAAVVALGLNQVPVPDQRRALDGVTAVDLAKTVAQQAVGHHDPGAVALAAWAAAEVAGLVSEELFDSLERWPHDDVPIPTVNCSWAVAAALSAGRLDLARQLGERLMASQGGEGIFPHLLPPATQGRLRAHVGCFADQVYPIQALARLHLATKQQGPLEAANRCADRICELQGAQGQWWWHYDHREGSVVERFPVYSVHQHAMAPMALLELAEVGGRDHRDSVALGLQWLTTHPEVIDELIADHLGVVWRKVGRREPRKAVRAVSAAVTSVRPGTHLPAVDLVFPPARIDYECRPYELGWLLYAWGGSKVLRTVERDLDA